MALESCRYRFTRGIEGAASTRASQANSGAAQTARKQPVSQRRIREAILKLAVLAQDGIIEKSMLRRSAGHEATFPPFGSFDRYQLDEIASAIASQPAPPL